MKKNIKKTMAAAAAAILMCTSISACSGKDGGSGGIGGGNSGANKPSSSSLGDNMSTEEVKAAISYKIETVAPPNDITLGYDVKEKDGIFYSYAYNYGSDGENNTITMNAFDESGLKYSTAVAEYSEDAYTNVSGMAVLSGGIVKMILNESSYNSETEESTSKFTLVTLGADGSITGTADITSAFAADEYANSFVATENGDMFFAQNTGKMICLSPDGQKNYEIAPPEKMNSDSWVGGIILNNKGEPAVSITIPSQEKYTSYLFTVDTEAKAYKEPIDIKSESILYSGSGDYIAYSDGDTGIKGIREDGTIEPVINLLNIGMDPSNIFSSQTKSDGSFILSGWDYENNENGYFIAKVIPVDPSQVKEKKAVTMGCFTIPWEIKSKISKFNKENEEYVILTQSYADEEGITDYDAAITGFNNQLLSGNIPDILVLNDQMPVDSYVNKGLFTDMYPLLDADTTLKREDLLPNVLKACEKDGKLYSIAPSFNAVTCIAKKSVVGDSSTLTLADAKNILTSLGDGAVMDTELLREDALNQGLAFSNYIDYENKTCDFDNDSFKALLEFVKSCPEETENYEYGTTEYIEKEMAYRNNKALFSVFNIYSFGSYKWSALGRFGEEISYVNFPTDSPRSNVILYFYNSLAISEKAANKEGAWEFIKTVLTDTIQSNQYSYYDADGKEVKVDDYSYYCYYTGFPVLKKDFDVLAKAAVVPEHYYDENGNRVDVPSTTNFGDTEVELPPVTQADIDKLTALLTSGTFAYRSNPRIDEIIKDETTPYFQGAKTVDEVAANIQSRVSIYISEQY